MHVNTAASSLPVILQLAPIVHKPDSTIHRKKSPSNKGPVDNVRTTNRPFPSSKNSHFQNKAKCKTFLVKMSFICVRLENIFRINRFALSLPL